jgi:hypothetical protein
MMSRAGRASGRSAPPIASVICWPLPDLVAIGRWKAHPKSCVHSRALTRITRSLSAWPIDDLPRR